ncbi:hypothetical protein FAVG1_06897 [Fusarium avenaceum]|nr:hypothetical protein FAVG1_06897 [Fusarium avenaceum]
MTRQSTGKPPARHIPDELVRRPKVIGTKRCRSGRPLPSSDDQCSKPEYQEPTSLSRSDSLPNNENDEIACINENQRSQEDIPSCSQLSLAQQMNLEQLLTERFSRWMDGIKYTAPPDDRLPPRKRFKTAQWQPGLLRAEEKDESEDDFVVIPHPDCRTGFFHLACPFYVHSPEKYQKCLIQHDASVLSHVLENTCERNDQKPLDGLTESQKAKLIKKDRYYFGESSRWRRIWSTVLPSIEQPQSPYLDRGEGLRVSMIRDFWAADGKKFVFDFVEGLDIYANEKSTTYRITCQKALDGLMNGVIEQDSKSNILSVGR